jgi:hypothetical protein
VLIETDDQKTTIRDDPQALIEEARQRQRQRAQRRNLLVTGTALLVIVGLGVGKLAQGGGATQGSPPPASSAPAQTGTITYEKTVEQNIVPRHPVETKTIEGWYTTPVTGREVVTISGGRRIEIGHARVRDKVLGTLLVNYLYDPTTKTIYRTGAFFAAGAPPTPQQAFKQQVLGVPGAHRAGTRIYKNRGVYIVKSSTPYLSTTFYVDKRTYQVLLGVLVSPDHRTVQRGIAYRTLPATKANLALASLSAMHPDAHTIRQPPPRIKELYLEATH